MVSIKSDPRSDHSRDITGYYPAAVTSAFTAPFTLHSVISPSHETPLKRNGGMASGHIKRLHATCK